MTRVLFYVVLLAAAAYGFAWLADRPGTVSINWRAQGVEINTDLITAVVALGALILAVVLLWSLLTALFGAPGRLRRRWRMRRQARRYEALSRGLVAVAAGDAQRASRAAVEAQRLAPREPLTLLLRAQAAQLAGDEDAAAAAFRALLSSNRTRILGLRGLYLEARRRGDAHLARRYAEEAWRLAPGLGWAGRALLRDLSAEGDWRGARDTLEQLAEAKTIDAATARRQRAVLLTAEAMDLEDKDPDAAARLANEAHKLALDLVPAAVIAARLAAQAGDVRRAARIVEATWRTEPNPDLAEVYAYARPGDSPRDRLKRVRALARSWENHPESAIAVARAAIEARDWKLAREVLEPLAERHPTQRICTLMAQIEEGENGDAGRVREWLARALRAPRDPAWTADGYVSDRWLPVSPVTGELDAFRWRVPLEEVETPLIEAEHAGFKPLPILSDRPLPPLVVPAPEPAAPPAPAPAAEVPVPSAPAPVPAPVPVPTASAPVAQAEAPVPAEAPARTDATTAAAAAETPSSEAPGETAEPATPPLPSPPPFKTAPKGLAGTPAPAIGNGEDKPAGTVVLKRAPDDPGVESTEGQERGRFRLF